MKNLRIVYMGTPEFAVAPLKALLDKEYNVIAVITAPDKPAGRGKKIQQSEVKKYALEKGLSVLQPSRLKDKDFLKELAKLNADLQIVVAFRMLPELVWNMPPLGTFNLHASLLPQYRGAAPIHRAIMNGETKTGITTFFLQHEIDTGNILLQEEVAITENMTTGELYDILMNKGANLVLKTVKEIEGNNIEGIPQKKISNLKTAAKIFKEDCKIDWTKQLKDIHNHIRGLNPFPVAWTKLKEKNLKIFMGEKEYVNHSYPLATIITDKKTFFKIAVLDGYYHIKELQLEGKKRMVIEDFLRGYHLDIEEIGFSE